MLSIHRNKYPENELLGVYGHIVDNKMNRLEKMVLILKNKIPLRFKELLLLLLKK